MKANIERFLPIIVRLFPARGRAFLPIFNCLLPIFIRLFPIVERLVPVVVSYFLERALGKLKTEGKIKDYRTRSLRIAKFHYRIDVRLVVTTDQVTSMLTDLLTKIVEYSGVINGR